MWDFRKRSRRNTPGVKQKVDTPDTCWCGAPRWNRTKMCRPHYFQDYRKRKKGIYDSNAARKRRGQRHTFAAPPLAHRQGERRAYWLGQGVCPNRWCHRRLVDGACAPCGRFALGLCYLCPDRLDPVKDRWPRGSPRRWHRRCEERRRRDERNEIKKRQRQRNTPYAQRQREKSRQYAKMIYDDPVLVEKRRRQAREAHHHRMQDPAYRARLNAQSKKVQERTRRRKGIPKAVRRR
jgi:hypothetical protein